jgi:hypothetical protein
VSLVEVVKSEVMKAAGKVAAGTELRNIFLLEAKAALAPPFVEGGCRIPEKGLAAKTGHHSGKFATHKRTLRTTLQFHFSAGEEGKSDRPLLVIAATFIAEYQMAEGFNPSPKELNAFMKTNAVFNCWPYWREYVNATAARMNLPHLTLPFFRVRTERPEDHSRLEERIASHRKLGE